jgi:hypothetical protein
MRDELLLLKATKSLSERSSIVSKRVFSGMLIVLMILNVLLIVIINGKDHSTIVINFANLLNISTTYIIIYGYILRNNSEKYKNDFLKFAIQIPVSKKAVSISKFIQIWIVFIPLFIIIIVQNILCYIKSVEGMSGYIGLCTILACIQFILISLISGFYPYIETKRQSSKAFGFLLLPIIFLSFVLIFGSIGSSNDEIYYGMLGSRFVTIFERLEFFSGITGGLVSIISIALGYLLSFDIPNKIFGKKGWSV